MKNWYRATTVVAACRDGNISMASDGQVTVGDVVMKGKAQKVRLTQNGKAILGLAGGAADALALSERFEAKLDEFPGNIREPPLN